MVKCLVQGPARVGKTHVKALVMKKKLDKGKSPSTDCVEQAVRAICTDTFAGDGESWKEVSPKELKEMIVKEMKHQEKQSQDKADSPNNNRSESIDSPSKNYSESRDNTKSPSEQESESHLQSEVATKEVVTDQFQAQEVSSSASKPSTPEEMPEAVGHKLFEELKELIKIF